MFQAPKASGADGGSQQEIRLLVVPPQGQDMDHLGGLHLDMYCTYYLRTHTHMFIYTHTHIYIYIYVRVCVCMYVCVYVYKNIYIYMYIDY